MACKRQCGDIFRKQLLGYSPKGTHIFSLRMSLGTVSNLLEVDEFVYPCVGLKLFEGFFK